MKNHIVFFRGDIAKCQTLLTSKLLVLSRISRQEKKRKMKQSFGEYIHDLRSEHGYTLTQLGALLGIDSGALSKIENGKKSIDQKCLPKLAEVFDLDLELLKNECLSEKIANAIILSSCNEGVLKLVEEKVQYLKNKKSRQTKLAF